MKKLNFKLFTVAIFLAATFATLTPTYAQNFVSHIEAKRYVNREIERLQNEGIQLNINIDILKTNEVALKRLEMALKDLNNKVRSMGNEISIEITTNAPTGYPPETPPGTPVTIPTYDINDTIPIGLTNFVLTSTTPTTEQMVITPKFVSAAACIVIVVCIVVLGLFIYLVYRICKGVQTLMDTYTSKINTNDVSFIPHNYTGDVYALQGSTAYSFSRNSLGDESTIRSLLAGTNMTLVECYPKYSFTNNWLTIYPDAVDIFVESQLTLNGPWKTECVVNLSSTNNGFSNVMITQTNLVNVPAMFYRIRAVVN